MNLLRFQVSVLWICCISIASILSSCATKRTIPVLDQPIPLPETKIYATPDVDWLKHSVFTLDLQEVGTPETSRNQILEKFLFMQIVECLDRKGYHLHENDYEARIRLYFGVKEEKVSETETMLAYGVTGTYGSGLFSTQYSLSSGLWRTATLASTAWTKHTVHETAYEGEITVEVFDREGKSQLWRGDVRMPLINDDIRVASDWMIRELLWYFPTLDYPAVTKPEIGTDELDKFWSDLIAGREFYSPGQRYPVSFGQNNLSDTSTISSTISLEKAKAEFAKTEAYKHIKAQAPSYQKVEESGNYKRAFQEYLDNELRNSQVQKKLEFRKYFREFPAIYDLLLTTPWSLKNEDGTIFFAGRYFIGADNMPTIIGIEAELKTVGTIETSVANYEYKKYFITKIYTLTQPDYKDVWEKTRASRKMVLGPIDLLPEQPTPAVRIEQGS